MSGRPTALVVDDSHAFLMYLSILLNRMNLEVLPVSNAEEALELARVTRPKVITMDMRMPGMDGLEAIRTMRADDELSDIPVIMITSFRDKNHQWEALSLGCVDVLDKPIDLRRLHTALQRCNLYSAGRRRYLRAPFTEFVELKHKGGKISLSSVTLSERGIFVRMREPLVKGTKVDVTIPMPAGKPLQVGGQVIYAKSFNGGKFVVPPGAAIKFDRLTMQDIEALQKLVTDLLIGDIITEQEEEVIKAN
jgi:CheY-like chemotaxis protein